MTPTLGRVYKADPRDRKYLLTEARMRAIPPAPVSARRNPWKVGPILDQQRTSECVEFCFGQSLQTAPICHTLNWPQSKFDNYYQRAQAYDGITGVDAGSTARGCLMAAKEDGLVSEFLWVTDEDTAKEYLRTRGTLMLGTDWMQSMFTPDKHGYVDPGTGPAVGGHEYMERWYYAPNHKVYPDTYEYVNSWGPSFGKGGHFFMKADVRRYLWLQLNGDLVLPVEAKK